MRLLVVVRGVQPALKTFAVNPGVDFDYSLVFYQGMSTSPVDLTRANAVLTIDDGAGDSLFSISSGSSLPASGVYFGGVEGDPTNGVIAIHLAASDITSFMWQYARYVLEVTTISLGAQNLLCGSVAVVGFTP